MLRAFVEVAQWDGRVRPGATMPGVRIAVLMPTLTQARKVHQAKLLSWLSRGGDWAILRGDINKTELRIDFPGGSWIQFVSAEAADNARGIRCDFVIVDEADDVPCSILDAVVIPWFSEPHSMRMVLLAGTPKRGRYGLLFRTHRRALDGLENHHSFHATCYDFPDFISPEAVAKAQRETPEAIFKREWLCDFDAAEGLVYSTFSERFHVVEPDPDIRFAEYIGGVDWGYEDPFVVVVFGVAGHGKGTVLYLVHETYRTHLTDSDVSVVFQQLDQRFPGCRYFADPSRPQTIASVRKDAQVNIKPADNAIEDGIATVQDALCIRTAQNGDEWAGLYVSPKARNAISEFGLYRRKRDRQDHERVTDDIEDSNNHAMDAIRYAIHTRFGQPSKRGVRDIAPGL